LYINGEGGIYKAHTSQRQSHIFVVFQRMSVAGSLHPWKFLK